MYRGGGVIYIIYQTGCIMWLSDHPRKWKYRWRGAENVISHWQFWKKIVCYFSYPSTPPTLLMLESPNLYAWYPYAYRCWQHIWKFSPSSSFENIQILEILPENAISLWIIHEIGINILKSYTSYIKRILSCDFQITLKNGNIDFSMTIQILKENCLLLQLVNCLKLLGELRENVWSMYQMDFVIWLSVHTIEWILMVGAGIFLINICFLKKFGIYFMINMFFYKEIWSILQLPTNFSYTFDARCVKHAFMIHKSMLIMAMYIKSNSGFWFYNDWFFVISHINTNSLL